MYDRTEADDLDAWCARIPGLWQVGPGHWKTPTTASVSFPLEQHEGLAETEPQSYWFGHRNRVLSDTVRRFAPTGPIIDVGGGNGFVAMALLDAGLPTIVVEPGPVAAAICVSRKVPVIQATLQDLDLKNGSLDAVGMFDVLEHIEEDGATLAQIHSLLRPGGHLYVTVPAYGWLWSPEDVDAGHYRRYTRASLAKVLRAAGFEVQYQSYLFSALVVPLFIFRTLMGRLGVRKAGQARQSASEHKLPDNFVGRLLARSLNSEARRISQGQTVHFGTSCFAVARARTIAIK